MKKALLFFLCLSAFFVAHAQELYIKTFGSPKHRAVIFLHGGPGYNSSTFEVTTAKELSKREHFVVVFDRSGEGRSSEVDSKFDFETARKEILSIYERYGLKNAVIVGHSFGGLIGSYFAAKHPDKVETLFLVSTPLRMQDTFKNIIARTKEIYTAKNDTINLNYIHRLEAMDTTSMEYASYCFYHAMSNGFYTPAKPSDQAAIQYKKFESDSTLIKYAQAMDFTSPGEWHQNTAYTTLDITDWIKSVINSNVQVRALYGKNDGLFSAKQIADMQQLIGDIHVRSYDNCGHSIFIDQQPAFIMAVEYNLKY